MIMADITPWRGRREVGRFRNEMDRLFDDFFARSPLGRSFDGSDWTPAVDMSESEDQIVVNVEVPGRTGRRPAESERSPPVATCLFCFPPPRFHKCKALERGDKTEGTLPSGLSIPIGLPKYSFIPMHRFILTFHDLVKSGFC